jgi:hypothetical protein
MDIKKSWVVIQNTDGLIEAWRDYGTAWASPLYTVLGYFDGSHSDALRSVK